MTMSRVSVPAEFDFADPDVYAVGLPVDELAELRRVAPIWWNAQPIGRGGFDDGGFWAVTKHKDVRAVSLRNDVFSSFEKTVVPHYATNEIAQQRIEAGQFVLITMDAPRHTRMRKIISRGFTARAVERLRSELNSRAQDIAKQAAAAGDFVEQVASELPLQAIAGLLGVPLEDRKKLFDWSNQMVGDTDPEYTEFDPNVASIELLSYAMQLAMSKADEPGDDIATTLLNADVEGQKLSDEEFGFLVVMLAVAGSETTRNSITHGMIAFIEHPDQWEVFKRMHPSTAITHTRIKSFRRCWFRKGNVFMAAFMF